MTESMNEFEALEEEQEEESALEAECVLRMILELIDKVDSLDELRQSVRRVLEESGKDRA